jgi:hypothetical protein
VGDDCWERGGGLVVDVSQESQARDERGGSNWVRGLDGLGRSALSLVGLAGD